MQRYALDLFSNFTFFLNDPVNGDGIEQVDERYVYGSDIHYSQTVFPWERDTTLTGGFQTRRDRGRVILATQTARARRGETNDVDLSEVSYSPYVKLDSRLLDWIRFVGGARADIFHFNLEDRLDGPLNGSETDWVPSVKGNLIFGPWRQTEFFANAATGFHSNDARDVILNPDADTLPQAVAYEAGVRSKPVHGLELVGSLWLLNLESELVFVGDAGETEPSGRTRRYGSELGARWSPWRWLMLTGDVTVTKAYYSDTGEAVARAPKVTARLGTVVRTPLGVETSLEARHLGTRWLVENRRWEAQGSTIVDWTARYRPAPEPLHGMELFISIENLLDADHREAQFLTESQLAGEPGPVEDLHFSAGQPRTFLAGITVYF
jgi:outer membrane receptor protein involved in Fe transport